MQNIFYTLINSTTKPIWLVTAFVCGFIHFFSEPCRWSTYIRGYNYSLKRFVAIFSFTALSSYLLPFKLGIPFRIYLLKNKTSMDTASIVALLTVDGFLYYFCWATVALMSIIYGTGFQFNRIPQTVHNGIVFYDNKHLTTIATITAIIALLMLFKKLRSYTNKRLRLFKTALSTISTMTVVQICLGCTFIFIDITSQVLRHYAIFAVTGTTLHLEQALIITSISIFMGLISMLPMGLVGYDATVILLSNQAGLPVEQALLVPVINRFISLAVSFILGIWGGFSLGFHPIVEIKSIGKKISR